MLKSLAKKVIRTVQSEVSRIEHSRAARHVTRDELAEGLRGLGIESGDLIFLHSSLKSLGYVDGGPKAVLGALLDVIGERGTLIVPTYHQPGGTIFATCALPDYVFDPAVHGTDLGALPSAFLGLPGVRRSLHPTHSVSAVGPLAGHITEAHHLAPSIFGEGSPWERFLRADGKLLGLGITMGPVTFYHCLEDLVGDDFPLPVRMQDVHRLRCRAGDGSIVEVPVRPLDPGYMPRRIDTPGRPDLRDYFWREFSRAGLLNTGGVGESTSWWVRAGPFYGHLERLMGEGITVYATPEDLARRPIG